MTPLSRYVVETVITLMAVIALSIVLLSALRRVGVGKATGPLELVARLPLEGRRAVYLVRVGETVYVLGASENAMQKLGELPQGSLPAEPSPEQQSFAQVLRRAVGLREPAPSRQPPQPPAGEPPSPEGKA
jgi:flagellar biogenesis protein FliO